MESCRPAGVTDSGLHRRHVAQAVRLDKSLKEAVTDGVRFDRYYRTARPGRSKGCEDPVVRADIYDYVATSDPESLGSVLSVDEDFSD
jgi:hypothetical protein